MILNAHKFFSKSSLTKGLRNAQIFRSQTNSLRVYRTFTKKAVDKPKCVLNKVSLTLLSATGLTLKSIAQPNDVLTKEFLPNLIEHETIKQNNNESTETVEQNEDAFSWSKLWGLIRPHWIYLVASIISSIATAYLNIQLPICLGSLVEVISKSLFDEDARASMLLDIRQPTIQLISLYIMQGAFTFCTIAALTSLGERIASSLRVQLMRSLLSQDAEFFDRHQTGELVSRCTLDVNEFKSSFKLVLSQGLRSITQVFGCAASLYFTSPKLAIAMGVLVPAIVGIGSLLGILLRSASRHAQAQLANCAAVANEAIANVRTVKMFAMEDTELEAYAHEVHESQRRHTLLGIGIGLFQGLTNIALNGIILVCLAFGGLLISRNEMRPGQLMSFLVAAQTIQKSLANLSLMFGHYVKCVSTGGRIFYMLSLHPHIVTKEGIIHENLVGDVRFKNVNFSYPTRASHPVLREFDLHLKAGKVTALCGFSGAGKSTIAMLLERFYDVQSGSITLDGVDVRSLDLQWLRSRAIGYINQEPTLFHTSILENIRYAKPDATDAQVIAAAQTANAHTFINKFPNGYQTVVGERGVTISGGQKQRIAIARAILKDPAILILDEATSALDARSETLITKSLEKIMNNRTVLIIAHRLSTIRNADTIVVLNDGQVVETGTHQELLNLNGAYCSLMKQQQQKSESINL